MIVSINGVPTDYFIPRYVGQEIFIGIDSSKRNSAIAIGNKVTEVIDYIELNGCQDGTREEDVLYLCQRQRQVLKEIFKGSNPKIVGLENIITKDTKSKEIGITMHLSRFKITAVFMSFISFFQDIFDITPTLVNNQTWKSSVLPEEFCKRKYDKGSLAYFKSINSKYQYCTHDVTDAICILKYLRKINNIENGFQIIEPEPLKQEYISFFAPIDISLNEFCRNFFYNEKLTLKQNEAVMANNIKIHEYGITTIKINNLSFTDIYEKCRGIFKKREEAILLVVKRCTHAGI
ncbi:MAG: hypothetical protein HFI05_01955 [Lachnospiraceae bacterium]|nr:hypothetical protein [Lachnospiraceae bacterium]